MPERASRWCGPSKRPHPPALVGRLGTAALTVLLLAGTAFLLFVAYGTTVGNRWYKIVAIEGGSMAPAIEQGDAILITRPPATLKAGMVVVLQVEKRLVTHRVVAVRRDGSLVTRGDANDHVDDWANLDVRVVGVVQGHLPLLGRLLRTVGSGSWLNDQSDVPGERHDRLSQRRRRLRPRPAEHDLGIAAVVRLASRHIREPLEDTENAPGSCRRPRHA